MAIVEAEHCGKACYVEGDVKMSSNVVGWDNTETNHKFEVEFDMRLTKRRFWRDIMDEDQDGGWKKIQKFSYMGLDGGPESRLFHEIRDGETQLECQWEWWKNMCFQVRGPHPTNGGRVLLWEQAYSTENMDPNAVWKPFATFPRFSRRLKLEDQVQTVPVWFRFGNKGTGYWDKNHADYGKNPVRIDELGETFVDKQPLLQPFASPQSQFNFDKDWLDNDNYTIRVTDDPTENQFRNGDEKPEVRHSHRGYRRDKVFYDDDPGDNTDGRPEIFPHEPILIK